MTRCSDQAAASTPTRGHPERSVQAAVVTLLRALGGQVFVVGTTRRRTDYPGAMMSPGIPDVISFIPRRGSSDVELLFVEVKSARGKLRHEQRVFRELCIKADIGHVTGGVDDLVAWLEANGYVGPSRRPR